MSDMLSLTAHLPTLQLDAGAAFVREGESAGGLWILVTGALQVRKDGVAISTIRQPGAVVGEISLLLDSGYSATVETLEPSLLRYAADGHALLAEHPQLMRLIAAGLAERLRFVTTYLADLKHQYGDAPGLSMVPEVLNELALRRAPPARAGSLRDPEPDY